jgi:ATP dependent DNA ligase C terminal region
MESAWHLAGVVNAAEIPGFALPRGRLDRSRRRAAAARRFAARLLRSGRKGRLCRARRHRHQAGGAGAPPAPLQPLATDKMPLAVPPRRDSRFGSPLVLSRVHWVRPELVAEVKYLTWTGDNLLRQVVYEGLREDKPAVEVRRSVPPHPKT